MNSILLSHDQFVMMFVEAEARRIYVEWAYKRLEKHEERSVLWDDLSKDKKDFEDAKERLV